MQPLFPGSIYHICNHANGNENIFATEENYRFFLQKFKQYIYPVASLYAYCLLPNHFHWLLKVREVETLNQIFSSRNRLSKKTDQRSLISKQFSNFFSAYAQSFNIANNRMGSLFMKNFKRELIESELQFQNTFLYIQLNAVKHGFVQHEKDWRWSSCSAYFKEGIKTMIDIEGALYYFGDLSNMNYCMKERRELILSLNYE
jgi:REP element-mobilizing transposase RayT